MKNVFLSLLLLCMSLTEVFAQTSHLSSVKIDQYQLTTAQSCSSIPNGFAQPIRVVFTQEGSFTGNVEVTLNVRITNKRTNTIQTTSYLQEVFVSPRGASYEVVAGNIDITGTDQYEFFLNSSVRYPGVTSPSTSSLYVCGTALPVELVSFTGTMSNGFIKLGWSTATEKNAEAFYIQGSTDGVIFTTIDRVAATGNSSSLVKYSYSSAANGQTYYRLKCSDVDGQTTYSPVIIVKNGVTNPYLVKVGTYYVGFDIPADEEVVRVTMYDFLGRVVGDEDFKHFKGVVRSDVFVIRLTTGAGDQHQKIVR